LAEVYQILGKGYLRFGFALPKKRPFVCQKRSDLFALYLIPLLCGERCLTPCKCPRGSGRRDNQLAQSELVMAFNMTDFCAQVKRDRKPVSLSSFSIPSRSLSCQQSVYEPVCACLLAA